MTQFISYEGLPINSGGAHHLGRKAPLESYEKILEFLNKFADKTVPKDIQLTLYQSEKKAYSVLKLIAKLSWNFGIPKFHNDGLLNSWSWKISLKDLEKGFEILKINNDLPENTQGPIVLSFLWNFSFKDITTNQILPNQDKIPELDFRIKNSQIYLRTSKKSSISVWFALPFEEITNYGTEYINELRLALPFKASDKHWRIWRKSVNGNWIPRKLEIQTNSDQQI